MIRSMAFCVTPKRFKIRFVTVMKVGIKTVNVDKTAASLNKKDLCFLIRV